MAVSHVAWIMKSYFFLPPVMTWLIIFLGLWPIALGVLFAFAARVDPRSGRWRRR